MSIRNIGENLRDLGLGKDSLILISQAWPVRETIVKLNSIQIKIFYF